jgi:hypothetical protein
MNYRKVSDWLQISANLGIVVGLLLVGVQLKQNSDLLKTQLLFEESRRAVDLETLVVGENGAETWARSISSASELSLSDQRIMEALLWGFVEQLRSTRLLAELGLLDDDEWRWRVRSESAFWLANDYGRAWWMNYADSNTLLPDDLISEVNLRLAEVDANFTAEYAESIMELLAPIEDSSN